MESIIEQIRETLKKNSDVKTWESGQRFFKGTLWAYGVKTPMINKISKEYFRLVKDNSKIDIFNFCDELWQSGYLEESVVASNWSYALRKQYEPDDFRRFETWVNKYVNNWASCDTLCNHTIGEFIEMYPEYLSNIKEFTKSKNRWMRRAASVCLILPAKKGKFFSEIIEIANLLLTDQDDLVQKGYGWMLKEASKQHQQEVFDYVISKKAIMPRTALRYAIEKMPQELRKIAMEKP